MHFLPTSDQLELQRGVRDLLDARFPLDKLPGGYDAGLWLALEETGVFSLRTELGLGLADTVLVVEELGRACVPGPVVGTLLAASHAAGAPQPLPVLDTGREPLRVVAHLEVVQSVLVLDADGLRVAVASELA